MNEEFTNWFDGISFVPGSPGLYQRDENNFVNGEVHIVYSYWDGQAWYLNGSNKENAMFHYHTLIYSTLPDIPFRGLIQQWND